MAVRNRWLWSVSRVATLGWPAVEQTRADKSSECLLSPITSFALVCCPVLSPLTFFALVCRSVLWSALIYSPFFLSNISFHPMANPVAQSGSFLTASHTPLLSRVRLSSAIYEEAKWPQDHDKHINEKLLLAMAEVSPKAPLATAAAGQIVSYKVIPNRHPFDLREIESEENCLRVSTHRWDIRCRSASFMA